MKNFESFLAPQLNDYLTYRQSLGYSTKVTRAHLLVFDRYLRQTNADQHSLQPFYFLEMRANLGLEARSVNRLLSSVRVFFNFLLRREYVAENPLQDIPPLKENAIIPFVLAPAEIEQLLQVLCKRIRTSERRFLTDLAMYLAVLLLARCGMRISEPLKLMKNHYRKDDGTLYIERTKFKKQRLIPVPRAVNDRDRKLSLSQKIVPPAGPQSLPSGRERQSTPKILAGRKRASPGAKNDRHRSKTQGRWQHQLHPAYSPLPSPLLCGQYLDHHQRQRAIPTKRTPCAGRLHGSQRIQIHLRVPQGGRCQGPQGSRRFFPLAEEKRMKLNPLVHQYFNHYLPHIKG